MPFNYISKRDEIDTPINHEIEKDLNSYASYNIEDESDESNYN